MLVGQRSSLVAIVSAVVVAVLAADGPQPPQPPPSQVPGPFRSRVTLVPVDVRVLDRNGKPITGLKQTDFTVLENNQRQEIQYFEASSLTPQAPQPGAQPAMRTAWSPEAGARKQRIFLIVLGRGRLQDPAANAVDAAVRFTRERLLPQDQVAVLAYNRASGFTSDHEQTAVLLGRFKKLHEPIEAKLRSHFSGLAAVYGRKTIPPSIQGDIDAIFRGTGASVRQMPAGSISDAGRVAADTGRGADELMRAEILGGRDVPPGGAEADRTFDLAAAERIDLPFDDYVEKNLQTMQDLGNIYTGIEYMRYLNGEKHLVFITESGLFLPRLEDDRSIAALANDSRVAIDVIHTGGFPPPSSPMAIAPMGGRGRTMEALAPATVMFNQMFQIQSSRTIAELTGGQVSAYTTGDTAFTRLDQSTRSQYLLGYYPSNAVIDGKYRRISVKVNRSGATALFRHGYYARQQLLPFDRKQFLTYSRMASAMSYPGEMSDLKLRLKPANGQPGEVLVEVTILPDRIAFVEKDGLHAASLEVAFFCSDSKEIVVGQNWQKIDLNLREEVYQRFMREGATYTARIEVGGDAKFVKAILYDYAADLLGSTVLKLP